MLDVLFALPAETLVAFLAAGIVLNLTPGADVIFATASGLAGWLGARLAVLNRVAAVLFGGLAAKLVLD